MKPEEALAELRQRVDRARVAAGLTKKRLAERTAQGWVKVSRTTVQQFFRADGPMPSMDTVTALATVLKLDAQALLDLRDTAAGSADATDETSPPGPTAESGGGPSGVLRDGPGPEPRLVGPIPPAALAFQHRAEADQLRLMLEDGGTAVLEGRSAGRIPSGAALVGLGGVGKSQLAADYARTMLADGTVDVVVWVTATERSAIVDRLAQAGRELCVSGLEDPNQAARAFLAWLAPKRSAAPLRWLVVLDDLTLPTDMDGLWPPISPHGRTLITTRRQDSALTGPGRKRLQIGLFSPEQAMAYLSEALAAYERTEREEDLAALAADLGHLPLALSQAAAYLADTGSTIGAYRQALADRATALHELAPDLLPDQQPHTVAAAWALSIEHADTLKPEGLARPLLHLAAFLDPYGIPATVLTSGPARAYLAHHRDPRPDNEQPADGRAKSAAEVEPVSAAAVERAISALRRLSLLTYTPDTPATAVRVHQLLQHAVRDALTPVQRYETGQAVANALLAAWPETERDTSVGQAMRSNTAALVQYAEDTLHQRSVHRLVYRMGSSLGETGQVAAARYHYQRWAETAHISLGPDHPDTLTTRGNFAFWRGEAGDAAGAANAFSDLLEDTTRVLGPDHPYTLTTWGNLAYRRGEAGDAAGAAEAFSDILERMIRVLGPDHLQTLAARNNRALWRAQAGDAVWAAEAFSDLLEHVTQVLGPDHPRTLTTRNNLAYWRGEAGDTAGAAEAFTDLLADRIRVLGPDHPDTLTTRNSLATLRGDAGDAAGAANACTELLEHMIRVLGPDHPFTLTAWGNLAHWLGEAGDSAGAAKAYSGLLKQRIRVLGPDHPDTLTTQGNLASLLGKAGATAEAAKAYSGLLKHTIRVLGPDHPDTLTARSNLAYWQTATGDTAGAMKAFTDLLADRIRVLGPDHPDTLNTRNNLATLRGEVGDAAGAVKAISDLLEDVTRVLGPDHPHTFTTRGNLAYWRGNAGDANGAAEAFSDLLEHVSRVLGPNHPYTLTTRSSLAYWQRRD